MGFGEGVRPARADNARRIIVLERPHVEDVLVRCHCRQVERAGDGDLDSDYTANFAFDDGSVRRATYTYQTRNTAMVNARGNAGAWDDYVLPRDGLTPYP